MTGKWFALIIVFVVVMVGLTASAVFLNWVTAFFFGPGGKPAAQQAQVSETEQRQQRGEEYRERQAAIKEKQKEAAVKNRAERELAAKIARESVPAPLTESQYSPKTGKVEWPKVLLGRDYEKQRVKLEQLLRERAAATDPSPAAAAANAADELRSVLKDNIREMSANDYIAARKFLESLAHMLRSPPAAGGG